MPKYFSPICPVYLRLAFTLPLRDSCGIGFRAQFNAEVPRQVMNFPIIFTAAATASASAMEQSEPRNGFIISPTIEDSFSMVFRITHVVDF